MQPFLLVQSAFSVDDVNTNAEQLIWPNDPSPSGSGDRFVNLECCECTG